MAAIASHVMASHNLEPRADADHLHGRGINLIIISAVLNSVAALLLTSRLVARLRIGRLFASDWVCLASFVSDDFLLCFGD